MGTTELIAAIAIVALAASLATIVLLRRRRTGKLRDRFGDAEYSHAVKAGGSRRHGETELDERTPRVESLQVQPLATADKTRFEGSWRSIQARFVDSPGGAVAEADQLLRDVMSTRGYPLGDFEQRAADISVTHPLMVKNYRTAHEIALGQAQGQASTEDLRQAMILYRSIFDELVGSAAAAEQSAPTEQSAAATEQSAPTEAVV